MIGALVDGSGLQIKLDIIACVVNIAAIFTSIQIS